MTHEEFLDLIEDMKFDVDAEGYLSADIEDQFEEDFGLKFELTDTGRLLVEYSSEFPAKFELKEDEHLYIIYSTSEDFLPEWYPQKMGGIAHLASEDDLIRDGIGFTHVNLHRRIDPTDAGKEYKEEFKPRAYYLQIPNLESYRTTEIFVHNEDPNIEEDQAP